MIKLEVSHNTFSNLEFFADRLANVIWPDRSKPEFRLADYVLEKAGMHWLSYESSQGKFVIALQNKTLSVLAAVRVMRFLNEQFHLKFVISADTFEPAAFGSFNAYKLINSEGLKMVLISSKSLPEPVMVDTEILKFSVKANLYRDLTGTYLLQHGGTVFACFYDLENKILECKEKLIMEKNILIEAAIKIGALQFKLEDLLSLRAGTQINFDLKQSLEIELEVGGNLFAKGSLDINTDQNAAVVLNQVMSG